MTRWFALALIATWGAVAVGRAVPLAQVRPASPVLYVTNERAHSVSIIDLGTLEVVKTVAVGRRPRGLAVSPDGRRAFVALSGSPIAGPGVDRRSLPPTDETAHGIGVLDTGTHSLLKKYRTDTGPETLPLGGGGRRAFIANEETGQVNVIDLATGAVAASLKVGSEAEGIGLSPDGRELWAPSEDDGAVAIFDTETQVRLASIAVGARPRFVTFLRDGSRAYVPIENGSALAEIDARARKLLGRIPLPEGMRPMGIVPAPDGGHLYVSTGRAKMVLFVDTSLNRVTGSVEVGPRPWGIAISDDGRTLFTANGPSNDVSVIDVAARRVTKRIPVGEGPWGVAVVPPPLRSPRVRRGR